jgi:hypothetical protein
MNLDSKHCLKEKGDHILSLVLLPFTVGGERSASLIARRKESRASQVSLSIT